MNKNEFTEYVKELLEPYGSVAVCAMFGGYGIYNGGVIIGIIKSNELYFKLDLSTFMHIFNLSVLSHLYIKVKVNL
ncbi:TfoX/Sxy family protein [Rickettsia massiliae]|nr:TfoX/Sxy family protein [Rickettsia massiliae]